MFTIRIPHKLIQYCNEKGLLKELAFFLHIKYTYSNSCIFNYSQQSLSKKIKCSRSKISRHIKFFLQHKWCSFHTTSLVFHKFSDIIEYSNATNLVCEINTPECILNNIYIYLLKNKKQQCDFAIKVRADLSNPKNLASYKSARKNRYKLNLLGESSENFALSNMGAASLFNTSVSSASRILRNLEHEAFIMLKRTREVIKKCCARVASCINGSGLFWYKGYLYKVSANQITFLDLVPVIIPLIPKQNNSDKL